jgi:hypothetical protein
MNYIGFSKNTKKNNLKNDRKKNGDKKNRDQIWKIKKS